MTIIKIIASGCLVYKQGKLTKMIFAPILEEYRKAESGETNGIQMTYRKAPKMQWLKHVVKKISCAMIALTLLTLIICHGFAMDIVRQVVTQEYEIMAKHNETTVDLNFDPEQFWINPRFADHERPAFHPFKLDDDLDFDFTFETDDDVFEQMREQDVFKMLGSNTTEKIVTPYFNTTEIEETPFMINETAPEPEQEPMPQPIGRGNHDRKKHHYKHHQRHPKNMMKQGFKFDTHKMTKEDCLRSANMMISFMMVFVAFWATVGIMFW